jgi:hypothetical protein
MSKQEDESPRTSRRSFTKLAATAVAAVPIGALTIAGQGRRRKIKQVKIRQASPITVGGGGSVTIDFDHGWYKKNNPKKPKQYWNPHDLIEKLWIMDENNHKESYPQVTTTSTITIHCVNDHNSSDDSPIVVTASPLGVEFDDGEYPFDKKKKVHYCSYRKITKVMVCGDLNPIFEAKNGKCFVEVDDPAR